MNYQLAALFFQLYHTFIGINYLFQKDWFFAQMGKWMTFIKIRIDFYEFFQT